MKGTKATVPCFPLMLNQPPSPAGFHVDVSYICLFPFSQPKSVSETSWRTMSGMDAGMSGVWIGRECRGQQCIGKKTQRHNSG